MRISDWSSDVCSSDLEGRPVDSIETGDEAVVFLDRTPFYAESGGQVGDTGELDEQGVRFAVADTQKYAGQFHGHVGKLAAGTLKVGDHPVASVAGARRRSAERRVGKACVSPGRTRWAPRT